MQMMRKRFVLAATFAALAVAETASAQAITPTGTRFGSLSQATFGGTGIPNDAVQVYETQTLTLGLTATQRCGSVVCNPALSNNGAGVFYANPGVDLNPPSPGDPYAQWNWNFFIGGADAKKYNYKLYYDFNAAAGNSMASHGTVSLTSNLLGPSPYENSWNLGMNFLTGSLGITPPPGTFDPNALGEYTFAIVAYEKAGFMDLGFGNEVGRVAMAVNTVPEPSSYMLVAAGLGGLAFMRRRKAMMT